MGVHQRLILGFIVEGHKSVSVVEEEGYKAIMRGFTKRSKPVDSVQEDHG